MGPNLGARRLRAVALTASSYRTEKFGIGAL
jgi:hypothetical protein